MRLMPQTVRLGRAMKSAPSKVVAADRGGKANRRRRPCPGRRNSQQLWCFSDVCHPGIGACRGPCCCYWPRLWPIMVKGLGQTISLGICGLAYYYWHGRGPANFTFRKVPRAKTRGRFQLEKYGVRVFVWYAACRIDEGCSR